MTNVFHRTLNSTPPNAIGGQGAYLFDTQGNRYLDASGGAAISCLGHQNEVVIDYFRKKGYKAGFLAHPYSTSGTKDIMKLSRIAVDRSTSFSLFKGRLGPGFVIYLQFIKILRKIPMW